MTVAELMADVLKAYPGANPEAMAAFRPVFAARFGKREGPHLRDAFVATLAEFKPKYGQPFPVPADFERHMPSFKHGPVTDDPPIDLKARKQRADSLFANWQQGQCRRADKGNPMIRRALENTARAVADQMGWKENPKPLVLTHDQLKRSCQAAISQERRIRYGKPPKDKHVWWQQLSSVAEEWGIRITPEWWDDTTGKAFRERADETPGGLLKNPPDHPPTTATPPVTQDPAAHLSLLKSRIKFFTDMGMVDYVEAMQRELATLEPTPSASLGCARDMGSGQAA